MKSKSSALSQFFLLVLFSLGAFWVLSCFQNDPEKSTELVFQLDTSLVNKFDSVKIEIFTKDNKTSSIWSRHFKLATGQKEIRIAKPAIVPKDYMVIITGSKDGIILYRKLFNYTNNKFDSMIIPSELVRDFSIANRMGKVGDTLRLNPTFVPSTAVDTEYTVSSSDLTKAEVLGQKIIGLDTGMVTLELTAGRIGLKKSFVLTLTPSFVKPESVLVAKLTGSLFDTLTPVMTWQPTSTTDTDFILTSMDTNGVKVIGGRLLAKTLGTYAVILHSKKYTSVRDTFDVTIRSPAFASEIKPITKQWCGTCHAPGITFNLQDSITLVSKGASALLRLQLDTSNSAYMPANKAVLFARDKQMLLYWLRQNVKPVLAINIQDTVMALGDSILPNILFTPEDATDRVYSLTSSNSTKLTVVGNALVAYETGVETVEVTSRDGGLKKSFKVTIVIPTFEKDIKPITTANCGKCHSPTKTFNLQDSTVLVKKGGESLRRVQLPITDPAHMPADTSIHMPTRQIKALVGWLNTYYIKLVGVSVADMVISLGETQIPAITFTPNNASNRNYSLILIDTSKITTQTGLDIRGNALTAVNAPVSVILQTEEGKINKAFKVQVVPVPMDTIWGIDTGGAVGDTVTPRILYNPSNASDTNWVLRNPNFSNFYTILPGGKSLVGTNLGNPVVEVSSVGTPTVKSTFHFAVGPVKVIDIQTPDQTVAIGSIFSPTIQWNPTTSTNKSYSLTVAAADTNIIRIYPPDMASLTPRLEALGVGTKTITLTTIDGNIVRSLNVTIGNVKPTSIKLTLPNTVIYVDSPTVLYTPTVSWTPTNTTLKSYTLSTGTPSLVAVGNKGTPLIPPTFRGLALGTGRITATSVDGPKDSIAFNLYRPPFSKVHGMIQARCFACHQGGVGSNPRLIDSAVALGPSISAPTLLMKDEIVRRIKLAVMTAGHMPADGTALSGDSLAIMVRYFSW